MTWRRAAWIAAGLAGLLAVAGCRRPAEAPVEEPTEPEIVETAPGEVTLRLYFPSASGRLRLEERPILTPEDHLQLARRTVDELLLGPTERGSVAPLPPWVSVGDLFVSPDGLIYLDLASPDDAPPPSSGSLEEMLSIYSLVNSLLLTDPQLEAVILLWNGEQRPSFAGHLDTSRPLRVKNDLIARG